MSTARALAPPGPLGPRPAAAAALVAGLLGAALALVSPVLAVPGAIAVLGGALLWRRPELALPVFLFLLFSNAIAVGVSFHGLPRSAGLLLHAILLLGWLRREAPRFACSPELPVLLAFLAAQVLSASNARDPQSSLLAVRDSAIEGIALFVLLVAVLRERGQVRPALLAVVAAGAFLGVFPVFQQLTGSFDTNLGGFGQVNELAFGTGVTDAQRGELRQHRLLGAIGEQNRFAQLTGSLLPLALAALALARGAAPRAAALLASGLLLGGFVLAFSRGGAAALLLTALAAVLLKILPLRRALLLGLLGGVLLAAVPQYRARLATIPNALLLIDKGRSQVEPDNAIKGRVTQMLAAGLVYLDHPLLGVGPEEFPSYSREVGNRLGLRQLDEERQSHNLVLGLAAELGTLGTLLFLALHGMVFWRLERLRRGLRERDPELSAWCAGLLLALVCYFANGLFLHLAYVRFFWALLGVSAAVCCVGERQLALHSGRVGAGPAAAPR